MDGNEARQFEQDPLCLLYIKMSDWNNRANRQRLQSGSISKYREMALHYLMNQAVDFAQTA